MAWVSRAYVLELLQGQLVLVGRLLLLEEHGGLVEVEDDVVEEEVADLEDDAVGLHAAAVPAHHPVGLEVLDGVLGFAEDEALADEDAESGKRRLLDVLLHVVLDGAHDRLVEVLGLREVLPVEGRADLRHLVEGALDARPLLGLVERLADVFLEDRGVVEGLGLRRFERLEHVS
jgi:hypothetical protein